LSKEPGLAVPDWGFNSSVFVDGALLVINAGSAGIALERASGKPVWTTGRDECGYGSPVPFFQEGRRLLAMFAAKHVVAVDPTSGKEAWRLPWKTDWNVNAADPVFDGGRMFLSSGYGTGCAAFDLSSTPPRRMWFNKEIRSQMASIIALGGHVYGVDGQGGDKDSRLKCLDLATGEVKWASPKAETGNLAAVDGRLLWLTGGGELVVVEARPDGYRELGRAQVGGGKHWTPPVLSNGRIYVRNSKGDLVCIEAKAGNGPG
jgi:outer membrane protein assembly factor BamB